MNYYHYINSPSHVAFHDLTPGRVVPPLVKQVLGLSRKFIPTKPYSPGAAEIEVGLERMTRDAHLKAFFADSPLDNKPPTLYVKSTWRPPAGSVPQELDDRMTRFHKALYAIFTRKRAQSNLLPFQHKVLTWLKQHPHFLVANTDKGLGPCILTFESYVNYCLKHLCDEQLYDQLTAEQAAAEAQRLWREITQWMSKGRKDKTLSDTDCDFIRYHTNNNFNDPHGYFYGMLKLHKKKISIRPVCSDVASITHPLGKWVDTMLQPIVQTMPTFFKDSYAFKDLVDGITVPIGGRLATADAVSMYTNINTNAALARICPYLEDNAKEFGHYHPPTLIRALEIVMQNNIMRFGDLYVKQKSGTVMGSPPAPDWANLFEGLHELEFLPRFQTNLQLYKRFIDDVFLVWRPTNDPVADSDNWLALQAEVGNNHGLEWEFSDLAMNAVFLDMTVKIDTTDGSITTSLYEKPMALFLFIPPHSAHPPGILVGHIYGNLLRIFRLNSNEDDIIQDTLSFFDRFLVRGHKSEVLTPLFLKGIENARKYIATSNATRLKMKEQKLEEATRRLYLHIEYHPQNPSSSKIQQLFDNIVLNPPGEKPLNQIEAGSGCNIPIDAMTIAYHRAPNLGEYFSYRNISKRKGPPVSSYIK